MTGNVLVYIFFSLFFLFLIESVYFLKKKLSVGVFETANQEENQGGGKWILIGGLMIVVILLVSFGFFFFSKQENPLLSIVLKPTPTAIPTFIPSPTTSELVYTFPTITTILPSPTLATIVTAVPTKTSSPSKTPTLTKIPSPTVTPKLKVPSSTPTIKSAFGGPVSQQGGPEIASPTVTQPTSSAEVIVPKMPVAGSLQHTLTLFFVAISSVIIGLIL